MAGWKYLPVFLAEHRLFFLKRNLQPPEDQSLPPNDLLQISDVMTAKAAQSHCEASLLETEENPTNSQGGCRDRIAFPSRTQASDLRQIHHC